MRLSLMYNVDTRKIMNVNKLYNDFIHHLDKISIPMIDGFKYPEMPQLDEDEAERREQQRRDQAIFMMNQYIAEVERRPGADFKAEALFYCEENEY